MASLRIVCFFEDIGQAEFIHAVIKRVAFDLGISSSSLKFEDRSASGGGGTAFGAFRRFLRDIQEKPSLLVVSIDGNCRGYQRVRNRIFDEVDLFQFPRDLTIAAVPEPHIERWYLAEPDAVGLAINHVISGAEGLTLSVRIHVKIPPFKCEKSRYKRALLEAFRQADIIPQSGGAEFAEEIIAHMKLDPTHVDDPSFRVFLDNVRHSLMRAWQTEQRANEG